MYENDDYLEGGEKRQTVCGCIQEIRKRNELKVWLLVFFTRLLMATWYGMTRVAQGGEESHFLPHNQE